MILKLTWLNGQAAHCRREKYQSLTPGSLGSACSCLELQPPALQDGSVRLNGASGWSNPIWRTSLIAIFLVILVVLYDGPLKRTIVAPFLMGGCRTANILLGASTYVAPATTINSAGALDEGLIWGLPLIIWWIAISIGFLISGATLLGRNEAAETQSRTPLIVAAIIVMLSLAALASCVYCPANEKLELFQVNEPQKTVFPLFVAFMAISILRRVIEAVVTLKPKSIQMGVVSVLKSLIIFDAALCYLAMPDQIVYALVVLSLLVPTLMLGRYMAST